MSLYNKGDKFVCSARMSNWQGGDLPTIGPAYGEQVTMEKLFVVPENGMPFLVLKEYKEYLGKEMYFDLRCFMPVKPVSFTSILVDGYFENLEGQETPDIINTVS